MIVSNILGSLPDSSDEELFEVIAKSAGMRIERIVSSGQATPEGIWYDQPDDEWVMLIAGSAALQFDGKAELCRLEPGDYLMIPAHCRHRVAWTDSTEKTIWLAVHTEPCTA